MTSRNIACPKDDVTRGSRAAWGLGDHRCPSGGGCERKQPMPPGLVAIAFISLRLASRDRIGERLDVLHRASGRSDCHVCTRPARAEGDCPRYPRSHRSRTHPSRRTQSRDSPKLRPGVLAGSSASGRADVEVSDEVASGSTRSRHVGNAFAGPRDFCFHILSASVLALACDGCTR
jgi:hypothetical protein